MKTVNISKRFLIRLSLIYIYVPVLLFLFGWVKLPIAVLTTIAMGFGLYHMEKQFNSKPFDEKEYLRIDRLTLITVLLFLVFVAVYCGWGRYTDQAGDWAKHNAVLADLMNKDWPVYYSTDDGNSMLTYYLAQYLVPALIGKIFNTYRVAEVALFIWTTIGLFLIYLNLVRILNIYKSIMQIAAAWILCFFSGPLLLAQKLLQFFSPDNLFWANNNHFMIWMDGITLQYSSHYVMLRWVFPQAIICWLTLLLLYEHREMIQHYVILLLPALIYGTFSFAGIIPICLGCAFAEFIVKRKNLKDCFVRLFSISNIVNALTLGSILILYFWGNITGEKPDEIGIAVTDYGNRGYAYFIFVACMVVSFGVFLFGRYKKNAFYWTAIVSLLILPIFKMGLYNDLVMRASIPGLFVLMLLTVDELNHVLGLSFRYMKLPRCICTIGLVLILLIGFIHPTQELYDLMINDNWKEIAGECTYGTLEFCANRMNEDMPVDLRYNYYSYDIENQLFYKYVARTNPFETEDDEPLE